MQGRVNFGWAGLCLTRVADDGLTDDSFADDRLVDEEGLLAIPAPGVILGDDLVRKLRDVEQR